MAKELKGLSVSVYRDADGSNYTNGGVTGRFADAVLVGEIPTETRSGTPITKYGRPVREELRSDVVAEIFPPTETAPALRLVPGVYTGLVAVPVVDPEEVEGLVGPMFGGNFIYTPDSRFPADAPIPVHDRWETTETYDRLRR